MPVIRSDNKLHEAACSIAEMQRQNALAGASTPAACKAADIAFYRAVIASCKLNGMTYFPFVRSPRVPWNRGDVMSATILDLATARRAAAAAAQKQDPFNNPVAVLIVQLVLMILIQERNT